MSRASGAGVWGSRIDVICLERLAQESNSVEYSEVRQGCVHGWASGGVCGREEGEKQTELARPKIGGNQKQTYIGSMLMAPKRSTAPITTAIRFLLVGLPAMLP